MKFVLTDRWREGYPEAFMGVLVLNDLTLEDSGSKFHSIRAELERELRVRYSGFDRAKLKALPAIRAYDDFYHGFKKTYHLLLQLESILGGKSIPAGNPLVSAMFMAELDDLLLTAGHDLDQLSGAIQFDVAAGGESYEAMNGEQQTLKTNDLFTADEQGVISSVIYGPDRRTRILPTTTAALFTTYGVPGITREQALVHLQRLSDLIQTLSPQVKQDQLEVVTP